MKVLILYRSQSEQFRPVEEFVHNFQSRQARTNVERIDLDTREGAHMAELYGITQYPAIAAVRNDGQLLNVWQGLPLPLMNEVAAYAKGEG